MLLTGHNVCTESGYYTPGGYGLDYSTENLNDYYDIIRSLAAEYGLNLIDLNALCAGEKDTDLLAKGDGIHLSTYGHEKYAEWIGDYMLGEFEWKDLSAQEPQESSSPADESGSEASSEPAEPSAAESAAASEPEKRGLSGRAQLRQLRLRRLFSSVGLRSLRQSGKRNKSACRVRYRRQTERAAGGAS